MEYKYNDGGRTEVGYKGDAGDCVVRAIAIAIEQPYKKVYLELKHNNTLYVESHRDKVAKTIQKRGATSRDGNFKKVYHDYILSYGWEWIPTMQIGSGCKVHLKADDLPGEPFEHASGGDSPFPCHDQEDRGLDPETGKGD